MTFHLQHDVDNHALARAAVTAARSMFSTPNTPYTADYLICREWAASRRCSYGSRCRYFHDEVPISASAHTPTPIAQPLFDNAWVQVGETFLNAADLCSTEVWSHHSRFRCPSPGACRCTPLYDDHGILHTILFCKSTALSPDASNASSYLGLPRWSVSTSSTIPSRSSSATAS